MKAPVTTLGRVIEAGKAQQERNAAVKSIAASQELTAVSGILCPAFKSIFCINLTANF